MYLKIFTAHVEEVAMILSDLIKEELILTNLKCDNQNQAINILYEQLFRYGYVKESYLQGVINREKTYPTGIKLDCSINVAIPHTEAIHVLKSGICLAILKNPIKFKRIDNPDESVEVSLIMMIAIKEQDKQVNVLEELVSMFQNCNFIEKLAKQTEVKKIVDLFKNNAYCVK